MKRQSILLVILILLGSILTAQQLTQQFSFSASSVQTTQTGGFDVVALPNCSYLQDDEHAGKPQLPIAHFKLLLPQGASATNVSLSINSEQQLAGNFYLFPVQLPVYANFEDPPPFVEPDTAIYNTNNPFPGEYIVEYATSGFRDYNYITVSFCPFRYIPLSQQLHLLTNVTITVDYTQNTVSGTHKLRPYGRVDEMAYEFVKSTVINPAQTDTYYPEAAVKILQYRTADGSGVGNRGFEPTEMPALEGSLVHYVIITNNTDVYGNTIGDFTVKFQEFANWKTQSGSPAKVITVDAIRANYQGIDVAEQIREFVKDAYRLWGTEYVLLGGNASIVPVRWMGNTNYNSAKPTDLYYSAIWHSDKEYDDNWNYDGDIFFGENNSNNSTPDYADFIPDIAVGRAPVDTDEEVDLFLKKNFTYARCSFAEDYYEDPLWQMPDGAWLNKQLNIGGIVRELDWPDLQNEGYNSLGLPVFWYVETNFSDDSDQYTMLEYYDNWEIDHPDWSPAYFVMDADIGKLEVLTEIANKPGIIFHIDHSGPNSLGLNRFVDPTYLNAVDWFNLPVNSKYPVMLSGGCHTTAIEMDFYISEQWINAPGGGVAFIGASNDLSTTQTYKFHDEFFDNLYDQYVFNIGLLKNLSSGDYLNKINQLLGDPELLIYTDAPVTMNVTHNPIVTVGNSDFLVNISNFPVGGIMKICLYKENEVFAVV